MTQSKFYETLDEDLPEVEVCHPVPRLERKVPDRDYSRMVWDFMPLFIWVAIFILILALFFIFSDPKLATTQGVWL